MKSVEEMIREREVAFIEKRMEIAQWVLQLMKDTREMAPELLEGIEIPQGNTAEELLPALYSEPFDEEAYKQQAEKINIFQQKKDAVAEKLNEESLSILSRRSQ